MKIEIIGKSRYETKEFKVGGGPVTVELAGSVTVEVAYVVKLRIGEATVAVGVTPEDYERLKTGQVYSV